MLKNVSVSVDVIKKTADDVLVAENQTEEITTENAEDVFDVIRDTTDTAGTCREIMRSSRSVELVPLT